MFTRILGLFLYWTAVLWAIDASAQIGLAGRITNPMTDAEADAALADAALSSSGNAPAFFHQRQQSGHGGQRERASSHL